MQVVEDILQLAGIPASKPLSERYRVLVVSDKETIESMRGACIDTIERRAANWTDGDEASWVQLGIPQSTLLPIGSIFGSQLYPIVGWGVRAARVTISDYMG